MSETAITVINGILLAGLWYLFAFCYRSYRIDLLRQRLFTVRDNLFKAAENNTLPFESRAYGMTRQTLNGMIRYAHRLSILGVMIDYVFLRKHLAGGGKQYGDKINRFLGELDKEGKIAVGDAHMRMHMSIISHLLHTSLLTGPLLIPIYAALKAAHVAGEAMENIVKKPSVKAPMLMVDGFANILGASRRLA